MTANLFTWAEANARGSDPQTSKHAAAAIRGKEAGRLESIVVNALAAAPAGLTTHGLVDATGLPWNTVSPRIRPLIRKGLVIDSGQKQTVKNRKCIVWKTRQ